MNLELAFPRDRAQELRQEAQRARQARAAQTARRPAPRLNLQALFLRLRPA